MGKLPVMEDLITCPHCSSPIEVTQLQAQQLRKQIEAELQADHQKRQSQLTQQQQKLEQMKQQLVSDKAAMDEKIQAELTKEKQQMWTKAQAIAKEQLEVQIKDRDEQLKESAAQLKQAKEHELALMKRERELKQQQDQLQGEMKQKLAEQLQSEKDKWREKAELETEKKVKAKLEAAMAEVSLEQADQKQQLDQMKEKLKASQAQELVLRQRERELKEKQEQVELEITKRMEAEAEAIKKKVQQQTDELHQLKDAENKKKIDDLLKQIDTMKRKAEQGSQQTQGEVQELLLEERLRSTFVHDEIVPVPKGVHGGDCVQHVKDDQINLGQSAGAILWESKRTQHWNDAWLAKARDDQNLAKAAIVIITSQALPEGVEHFKQIQGIWVTSFSAAMPLVHALRQGLLEVARSQKSLEGRQEKMELIYNYLAGHEFKNRIEVMAEVCFSMKDELEKEKRAYQRIWAKREKQLERAAGSMTGLYGDLQGIIGGKVPEIEDLKIAGIPDLEEIAADGATEDTDAASTDLFDRKNVVEAIEIKED